VQRKVLGMVKSQHFDGFYPIFPDFTMVKAPIVGRGTGGKHLPRPSHSSAGPSLVGIVAPNKKTDLNPNNSSQFRVINSYSD